jgi:hypothetical protein
MESDCTAGLALQECTATALMEHCSGNGTLEKFASEPASVKDALLSFIMDELLSYVIILANHR